MIALAYIYIAGMVLFYLWEMAKVFYPSEHVSLHAYNESIESEMVSDESDE